jgi:hypothetical protein
MVRRQGPQLLSLIYDKAIEADDGGRSPVRTPQAHFRNELSETWEEC